MVLSLSPLLWLAGPSGSTQLPAHPLTTAAVINGCTVNYEEMKKKEEEEQLMRIKSNLKEKKTVSNALLNVLMP